MRDHAGRRSRSAPLWTVETPNRKSVASFDPFRPLLSVFGQIFDGLFSLSVFVTLSEVLQVPMTDQCGTAFSYSDLPFVICDRPLCDRSTGTKRDTDRRVARDG